ncbi:MAG TPA: PilT/PilU family type 4a pilus ATPase [Acidobacteriota bacterium]|nr:PilT/PilU family type 4a pilus ATPase [Acidobacteriota bacterium]
MTLNDLLRFTVQQKASDLHVKPMRPPLLRVEGKLLPVKAQPIPPEELTKMIQEILTPKQKAHLDEKLFVDFGYSIPGVSRFRATVFFQRGTMSGVFRRIPFNFPNLEDWGLPPVLVELCHLPQGLVLVTGPTGAGKSSTLAAMIREITEKSPLHIVTIEDPIEFLFRDGTASITQREVGDDTHSFHEALRNTLRQDPDVIMVGEMRDSETIMTAMTAAETGHLVLSTLHTNSAPQTIDRILDSFPEGQHRQVRIQLSQVLRGIVSLQLVERSDQSGLIAAVEILRDNPKIQKMILEGNIGEISEEIEKCVSYYKMQTMNQSLIALVLNRCISKETALKISTNPTELDMELRKFLYASEKPAEEISVSDFLEMGEGDHKKRVEPMAEPLSDYSKIVELQEIKKLYEEIREKHGLVIADKDESIQRLQDDLRVKDEEINELKNEIQTGAGEREKLKQQLQFTKTELEGKIQRLQERVQQLSAPAAVPSAGLSEKSKPGFFKKN